MYFFIRNTDWDPSHGINSPYMTLQKGMLQIDSANTVHLPNFKNLLPFTMYTYIKRERERERDKMRKRVYVCERARKEKEKKIKRQLVEIFCPPQHSRGFIFLYKFKYNANILNINVLFRIIFHKISFFDTLRLNIFMN